MKKILLLAVGFVLTVAGLAGAHPPLMIDVAFDPATKTVTATIIHPVSDPGTHYIFKIVAALNGREIIEKKLDHQNDQEQEKISFLLKDAKPGDVISVEAYCNLSGKLVASTRVEEPFR